MLRTHKDLEAWKNSIELVSDIYKITAAFPKEEIYALVSQIRRSAVSIPSNIAEGSGRNHYKEFIQFLFIALGSMSELETQLIISLNLGFINKQAFDKLNDNMNLIRSQISGLIKHLKIKYSKSDVDGIKDYDTDITL